jgi:hypothetical protein
MTTSSNTPVSPVARIEALYDRLTRARTLIADNKVHPVYGMVDHYIVEGKEAKYLVNGSCICPDSVNRPELKGLCKHKLAATLYQEQHTVAVFQTTTTAPADSDRSLEDKLADLYPSPVRRSS